MATQPSKGKYNPIRKFMPGAPLPSLQQRAVDSRVFDLARDQSFTAHLHFYLAEPADHVGGEGLILDKLDHTQAKSHGMLFAVEGVPYWGFGMDIDTATNGHSDYIPVFDYSANGGAGADVFRWSMEKDAPAGTSKTCKFNAGRLVGTPRAQGVFALFNGGDNVTGLGGMGVQFWDESGTQNALSLTNRSSTKKRTLVLFNNQYLMGSDLPNTGSQTFYLYDNTGLGSVLSFDATGQMQVYHNAYVQGTAGIGVAPATNAAITLTAPSLGRGITINSDAGASIFMNPKSGTNRMNVRWGGVYQLLSDFANNGTVDFGVQNIGTGNTPFYCDATDGIRLGTTTGKMGFYGTAVVAQPTVTGSKGANAALTSLMTALSGLGLVIDTTT